ncbi:MAG: hypothetical protein RL653_3645 [Pseudomonadota bacterium]
MSGKRVIPERLVQAALERGCAAWKDAPTLSFPEELPESSPSIACIDLATRQVFFNPHFLRKHQVVHALPGLLAHEMGHHLEHPHTLRLSADLLLMGRTLFISFSPLFLNLFFDLLINETVGRDEELRGHLQALYRVDTKGPPSPLFTFYLAIYDALWGTPRHLSPVAKQPVQDKAEVFAQTFFGLSSLHDQFAYFCAAFAPFIPEHSDASAAARAHPMLGDVEEPSAEDFPADLAPSPAARRAIERALADGVLPADYPGKPSHTDPLQDALTRMTRAGLPGNDAGKVQRVLAERFYKAHVERVLDQLTLPPVPHVSDPLLPGPLEEADGADATEIDWLGSLNQRGMLAAAAPLRRTWDRDDDPGEAPGIPRLELYLDTSGSMPSPVAGLNAMTLAAQVLATLAVRRGSKVRACVYSHQHPLCSGWMQSEHAAREFLFHYIGGGTQFPFDVCRQWAAGDPGVVRVIISDADFVENLRRADPEAFRQAVLRSRHFVLLLLGVSETQIRTAWSAAVPRNFKVVTVEAPDAFAPLAAQLADSLFPAESR